MGMSASQARLLTITSRLHDVEYKAQNIMSQKIALATQKDDLYQDYCDKLDAKKIQVAFDNGDGTRDFVDATFSTMCKYDKNRFKQYALIDSTTGKVMVDAKTKQNYESFSNDKYAFAYAMLGMGKNFGWFSNNDEVRKQMGQEVGIGTSNEDYGDGKLSGDNYNLFMTDAERKVFENHKDDEKLQRAYKELLETTSSSTSKETDKKTSLKEFRDLLYKSYDTEIYKYMRLNKDDDQNIYPNSGAAAYDDMYPEEFPKQEFNYYIHLFEEIQNCGGCQEIDPTCEAGEEGNQWLNNYVNAGKVVIRAYDENNSKKWTDTSVATSTNQNYLREADDDKDLKKVEAEYEHELDIVNRKDTRYDQDLAKLETERTAINKVYEAVKKVCENNIEKTFKMDS